MKNKKPSEALPAGPYKGRPFIMLSNKDGKETLSNLCEGLGIGMDEIFEFQDRVHTRPASFESYDTVAVFRDDVPKEVIDRVNYIIEHRLSEYR